MSAPLVEGLLAGYGVAVPVGAVAVLIVGLTARTSLRVGACAALGVATADGLYCLAAVVGGSAAGRLLEPVRGPMSRVAALVLAVWAARSAYRALREHRSRARAAPAAQDPGVRPGGGERLGTPARAYFGLLGLTALNPATIVYFAALVLGRRPVDGGTVVADAVFVGAAFAASASWQLFLAGGGTLIGRVLTGPRGRLATALVSSAVVTVLAVRLLVTG